MGDPRPAVAHVVGTRWLNPSENWIHHQLRHLRDFRAVVLAKRTANLEMFPWEPVYALEQLGGAPRTWNRIARAVLGHPPFFVEACRAEDVALVHAHFGGNGRSALRLARRLDVPLVTSFYGRDMYRHRDGTEGLRRRYRALFAGGHAFLVEGPAARAQLTRIGCPPEKIHIHRLGVDLEAIPFHPRPLNGSDPMRVLMAARFSEKKGLAYGLEAFCRVAHEEQRLRLTVVGDAGGARLEVRIRDHLRALVDQYGLHDRVRLVGFLPNAVLHGLAREHHVFLHPSVHAADGDAEGGHPVVLTEMAASGMPIVATRHCDIPEVVVHGQTGWLCAERSVAELEAALRDAVARPETIAEYGRAGRRLVESRYDLRKQTLDPIYRGVLADGGSEAVRSATAAPANPEDPERTPGPPNGRWRGREPRTGG